ncbi:unnamed protein product, partial [Ilex paraguariensis]
MASSPLAEFQNGGPLTPPPSSGSDAHEPQSNPLSDSAPPVTHNEEPPPQQLQLAVTTEPTATAMTAVAKWPGWPGNNVFRLIVPVLKVGSIIGRKGELVKKMCEETHARIRILEGPLGTADRI